MNDEQLKELELKVEEVKLALSKKYNKKVYAYIVTVDDAESVDGKYAVIYVKEPERMVKLRVLDIATTQGVTTAGDTLLAACLCEESDRRIHTNDALYITMIMNVMDLVQLYSDVIKKK